MVLGREKIPFKTMTRGKSLTASTKKSYAILASVLLMSAINAHTFEWPYSSLRRTYAEKDGSEQLSRNLSGVENGSISLDSVNSDDTVTITLRQIEFGIAPNDCGAKAQNGSTAQHFFAVFTNPVTGQRECDYHSNVDACFAKTLDIACDPETKSATVELYIRDETWNPHTDRIINPMVGACLTHWPVLGKSRSWSATFGCELDPVGPPVGECLSDIECPDGHFCTMELGTCQAYEPEGGSCGGGMTAPGFSPQCDPSTMYCQDNPFACTGLTDAPGSCKYVGGICTSDDDCDINAYYCDESDGLCKEYFQMGDCCDDVTAPCAPPMTCTGLDMFGTTAYICQ